MAEEQAWCALCHMEEKKERKVNRLIKGRGYLQIPYLQIKRYLQILYLQIKKLFADTVSAKKKLFADSGVPIEKTH